LTAQYSPPTPFIEWNQNEYGKRITTEVTNESIKVMGNQAVLTYKPAYFFRIHIDDKVINGTTVVFNEIALEKPIQNIGDFKCNYNNGMLYFNENIEGNTLNVNSYHSEGLILYDANRITYRDSQGIVHFISEMSDEFQADETTRQSTFDTNETARQSEFDTNEATRISIFTTNETNRSNTFTTNEATRQSTFETNEAARSAWQQTISKLKSDSSVAYGITLPTVIGNSIQIQNTANAPLQDLQILGQTQGRIVIFGTNTITTTGADFTFVAGEVISITGCATVANNKVINIVSVSGKTMTFAASSFTPAVETQGLITKIPNVLLNGNFVNTNNWTSATTLTASGNVLSFTATAQYHGASQYLLTTNGHKYYISANVQSTSILTMLALYKTGSPYTMGVNIAHSGSGSYQRLSGIGTVNDSGTDWVFRIRDERTSGWDIINTKECMVIDTGIDSSNPLFSKTKTELDTLFSVWSDNTAKSYQITVDPTHPQTLTSQGSFDYISFGNILDRSTTTPGYFVDKDTGNLTSFAGYNASDYMPITPGKTYRKSTNNSYAVYNASKQYVTGATLSYEFTAPANGYYVRVSVPTAQISTFCIGEKFSVTVPLRDTSNNQLENRGIVATHNADGSPATWTAQDYVFKDTDGKWKLRPNIIKTTLISSYNYTFYAGYTNETTAVFYLGISALSTTALCSHFKAGTYTADGTEEAFGIPSAKNRVYFKILKSRLSGWSDALSDAEKVNLFKTFLTSTSIEFEYAYGGTITNIELSTADQTALNQAEVSFAGITNINSSSSLLQIKATAIKNIDTYVGEVSGNITNIESNIDFIETNIDNIEANNIRLSESLDNLAESAKSVLPDVSISTYARISSLSDKAREGQMNVTVKGNTLKNIVNNGNFANGTTGWTLDGSATATVANNICTVTTAAQWDGIRQSFPSLVVGHKYYITMTIKTALSGVYCGFHDREQYLSAGTTVFSAVAISIPQNTFFSVNQNALAGFGTIEISKVIIIDMGLDTSNPLFGKTTTEMDAMTPNYFDGLASVVAGQIKSVGKNLFNLGDVYSLNHNAITIRLTNGIKVKNTTANNYSWAVFKFQLKPNTVYSLKYNYNRILGSTSTYAAVYQEPFGAGASLLATSGGGAFTTPSNGIVAVILHSTAGTSELGEVDYTNIQLEEGSAATPYEPYTETVKALPSATLRSVPAAFDYVEAARYVKNCGIQFKHRV
jgi:hypothetical protein